MKRKQKTPRRVRPVEISDADCESQTSNDVCIQGSPDTSPKQPKLGAETQTDATPTELIDTEKPTDLVDGVKSSSVQATFKNESESGDMPLILNVFSLSQSQSQGGIKQLVDVQKKESSFPVTPPCSPPLVQLGPFRATPVMRQNAKYPPTNMTYYGFPRENYGPQITQVYSGEPQMQYLHNPMNHMAHNPHRIANGVLPIDGSMNQTEHSMYEQQAYTEPNNNTVNYYFDSHQNLVTNSGKGPIAHLRDMFTHSNKYLVPKESFVSKGSGLYARFKLQQNAYMTENIPPNAYVTSAGDFAQTPQRNVPVGMYYTDTSQTSVPNTIPSTSLVDNQGNKGDVGIGYSYPDNALYTDKYNTDTGCAVMLKGYGRNTVLQDEAQVPTTDRPGNWCQTKQPVYSQPAASGPIIMQINGAEQSSVGKPLPPSDNPDFLSPRDVKVQRLKRLLEEQEAAIKKLKTNH